jgi:hypothetical protein
MQTKKHWSDTSAAQAAAVLLHQLAPHRPPAPQPGEVWGAIAHQAYIAFVQICKGGSDDAGTYDEDEALVRRALKRLDDLESDWAVRNLTTPLKPEKLND